MSANTTPSSPNTLETGDSNGPLGFVVALDELDLLNQDHGSRVGDKTRDEFIRLLGEAFPAARSDGGVGAQVYVEVEDVGADEVTVRLRALQERLALHGIGSVEGSPVRVAFSAGIADLTRGDRTQSKRLAKAALLAARHAGGSRVLLVSEAAASRGMVLVAEDDEISAELIGHVLRRAGLDVELVSDGREVVKRARESLPALILLDVNLPHVGGFEIAAEIRKMPQHRHTPLVFLTSMNRESDILRGFSLGASDYVTKPFSPEELRARVSRWVPERLAVPSREGGGA